jgi:hypothetical protein
MIEGLRVMGQVVENWEMPGGDSEIVASPGFATAAPGPLVCMWIALPNAESSSLEPARIAEKRGRAAWRPLF